MTTEPIKLNEIVDALDLSNDQGSYYYSRKSSSLYYAGDDAIRGAEDEDEEDAESLDESSGHDFEEEEMEIARRILADEDDFVRLPDQYEIHEYSIIRDFCKSRPDAAVSEELSDLIRGSGAFRNFRRAIDRLGLTNDWYKYRDDAFRGIARNWCEENSIRYIEEQRAAGRTESGAPDVGSTERTGFYDLLLQKLKGLLDGERDLIANAANMASLLYNSLPDLNWAGFYFLKDHQLILGPFQGKPACTQIALGNGVCGTAAERRETIVVKNVHEFPGHIACDGQSNSEIVVPIERGKRLIGVLDLDSPTPGRFNDRDKAGLERLVGVFLECTDTG